MPTLHEVQDPNITEHLASHLEDSTLRMLHRSGVMDLPTDTQDPSATRDIWLQPSRTRDTFALENSPLVRLWNDIKMTISLLSLFPLAYYLLIYLNLTRLMSFMNCTHHFRIWLMSRCIQLSCPSSR